MSEINELIDRIIAIKDKLHNQHNKDILNEVCGILHKQNDIPHAVWCVECMHSSKYNATRKTIYCEKHDSYFDDDFACNSGVKHRKD